MSETATRPRWPMVTKLIISLLVLAFGIFLLAEFSQIVAPFILAVILAYILAPLARRIQVQFHFPKTLAIFSAYILFIALAIALPVLIVPYLTSQFGSINFDTQLLVTSLETRLADSIQIAGYTIDPASLLEQSIGALQQLIQPVVGQTITLVMQVVTSLVWVVFIFVVSFYLIKDADQLGLWLEHILPEVYRGDYRLLVTEINEIWSSFFRGQLLLALVVGFIFAVAGIAIGLPFALGMAVLAGLLEFLPSIGHAIWLILAVIASLLLGSTWIPIPNWAFALVVVGLHILFQQFDLNYLIPRIIGRSVHLPPLVVILGIVAAAVSVGVLGIPLAAPTIASGRVFGRYIYCQLLDLDPFPLVESTATPLPPPDPQWWRRRPHPKDVET